MAHRSRPKLSSRAAVVLQHAATGKASFDDFVDVIDEASFFLQYPWRTNILIDLANSPGEKGVEWFWNKWKNIFRPESKEDIAELGNDLRKLWTFLDDDALDMQNSPFPILNKWLAWRPTVAQLESHYQWNKRFRKGEELLFGRKEQKRTYQYLPFFCSSQIDKLIPDPNCLRAMLVQGVFEHWRHFSYCANLDCAAPYFIAKRKDQTVCDAEICKAEKQREHARKWWTANRAKRASGKATKGR